MGATDVTRWLVITCILGITATISATLCFAQGADVPSAGMIGENTLVSLGAVVAVSGAAILAAYRIGRFLEKLSRTIEELNNRVKHLEERK